MEFRSKIKIKDRSRITSSIIISFLAGFICYQFGEDIQQKIESSVKAISSNSNLEMYGPEYCESFNSIVNKSDSKTKKTKSGFYLKHRNNKENKVSEVTSSENFISEILKIQARTQKAIPDKNVDFSQELNKLIDKNSNNKLNEKFNSEFKTNVNSNVVADNNCNTDKIIINIQIAEPNGISNIDINKNGNGFEYNISNSQIDCWENKDCVIESYEFYYENNSGEKIDCAKSFENDENTCAKLNKGSRVHLKAGKKDVIVFENNIESEDTEIFIDEEELEEELEVENN